MKTTRYHKRTIAGRPLHPETQMLSYGYDPMLSEGAIKPPIFLTSTFVFRSAEEGKILFDVIGNRRKAPEGQSGGLVYSRYNNPNLEMLEDRLALIDDADDALVFSSGMAAITTMLMGYLAAGRLRGVHEAALRRDRVGDRALLDRVRRDVGCDRRCDEHRHDPRVACEDRSSADQDDLGGDAGQSVEHAVRHRGAGAGCQGDRRRSPARSRSLRSTTRCSGRSSRTR